MSRVSLNRIFTREVVFNPETHTYYIPGISKEIHSVTKIINPRGIYKTPKIEAAAELGKEIHDLFSCYLYGTGGCAYDGLFNRLAAKIEAAREDVGRQISVATERRYVAEFLLENGDIFYVGGSCDAVVNHEGGTEVIELKTTTRETPEHLMQLAAYTKFVEMDGGGKTWGVLAYLALRDGGQKVKHLSLAALEVFWEQFLAKIECFVGLNTPPPTIFTYVEEGEYVEITQDDVRELIVEYSELEKEAGEIAAKQKKIREQLDVISEKNNLPIFEIKGAKYAKIYGVKKCIDVAQVEEQYPQFIGYLPFTRTLISCR